MSSKKVIFFLSMYKMSDIRTEIWNKAKVSVISVHENDNLNKTLLEFVFLR